MKHPDLFIEITMFKFLIKYKSIETHYTGGWSLFSKAYGYDEPPESGLVPLTSMSLSDVDILTEEITGKGLKRGEDFAIADQSAGALVPCAGIVFEQRYDDGPMPFWVASLAETDA